MSGRHFAPCAWCARKALYTTDELDAEVCDDDAAVLVLACCSRRECLSQRASLIAARDALRDEWIDRAAIARRSVA